MLLDKTTLQWASYVFSTVVMGNRKLMWLKAAVACKWKQERLFKSHNWESSHQFSSWLFLLVVLLSCCDNFVVSFGGCSPPSPQFERASWVQTSPLYATVELLLNRPHKRVGKYDDGGQKLIYVEYLRCSVLYGTFETFATGKTIHHTAPLLTDFNVTGPHALVLNVSFHYWHEFSVN